MKRTTFFEGISRRIIIWISQIKNWENDMYFMVGELYRKKRRKSRFNGIGKYIGIYTVLFLITFLEAVKNFVSMDEKSLLIGIRYVKICCRIKLFLCCRISFLIIVLPISLFLYLYFKFFVHQSGISRRKIICGRCPHPASRIRLDFSGNTANANRIGPEHFLIR